MIFGNYPFTRLFQFTGGVPTECYIDLHDADSMVLTKTLVFDAGASAWALNLTAAETDANVGKTLRGDLVVQVAGQSVPVARLVLTITESLTARR